MLDYFEIHLRNRWLRSHGLVLGSRGWLAWFSPLSDFCRHGHRLWPQRDASADRPTRRHLDREPPPGWRGATSLRTGCQRDQRAAIEQCVRKTAELPKSFTELRELLPPHGLSGLEHLVHLDVATLEWMSPAEAQRLCREAVRAPTRLASAARRSATATDWPHGKRPWDQRPGASSWSRPTQARTTGLNYAPSRRLDGALRSALQA